jgi:hypothetical protein
MSTYKVNTTARYWTPTGNDAGTIPIGTTIELTGASRPIKDNTLTVYEIATAPYTGKFIEMRYLTAVIPSGGGGTPTIYITQDIKVYSDGSVDLNGIHYP